MIRLLFKSTTINFRPKLLAFNSTSSSDPSGLDLNTYHEASNRKLEELGDKLEELLEDRFDKGADVSLNNGVLTVVVDEQNTFVINKQTPNKQLWFSSPLSGPRRFDLIDGKWIDKNDRVELASFMDEELSKLLKS